MKKIITIILTYIIIIALTNSVFAVTGTVNTETARMRSEASSDATILELISISTEVEILGQSGDWYQVQYNGKTGYIRADLIDVEGTVSETSTDTSTDADTTEAEDTNEEQTTETANETATETTQDTTDEEEQSSITESYVGTISSAITIKILPSINSNNIGEIAVGTQITIKEIINDWCCIETDDMQGWARINTVETAVTLATTTTETEQTQEETTTETTETTTRVGYVNVSSVNVRREASTSSDIIDSLTINTEVTITGEESGWYQVQVGDVTGYISQEYISDSRVTETTSRASESTRQSLAESQIETTTATTTSTNNSASTSGAEVVSYAKQFLGYKYVSGGSTPSTGFDCSGFTYYVYKHFGITLSRSSTAQASNGTSVAKSDLQQGDLVIFNNESNTSIGHVGIYIGGNQFIHAANATKGVITTSLSDSYYLKRYVDARRIL